MRPSEQIRTESKMKYKSFYKTPVDFSDMVMISDGEALTNLYFEGSPDTEKAVGISEEKELEIFRETKKWLDIYFGGNVPDFMPKYKIENLTPFRKEVSDMMIKIPYGKTVTYGFIAKEIAKKQGKEKMSAQAVGGAVGWNPLCIIIPCHRVVGKNGKLTGYGGGIENKIALLRVEKTI